MICLCSIFSSSLWLRSSVSPTPDRTSSTTGMTETSSRVPREFVYLGRGHFDSADQAFHPHSLHFYFLLPLFSHQVIYYLGARQRTAKSFSFTAKCFRFGTQASISSGITKQHVWEDQMQSQIIFAHIWWIFKERPPLSKQWPTSCWNSV